MSKWIDLDWIEIPSDENDYDELVRLADQVASAPTLDLVRCRECRHAYLTSDKYCKFCDMWMDDDGNLIELYVSEYFYCAFGERKSDEITTV